MLTLVSSYSSIADSKVCLWCPCHSFNLFCLSLQAPPIPGREPAISYMDPSHGLPASSLAAAFRHIQALKECGMPREALQQALEKVYTGEGTTDEAISFGPFNAEALFQNDRPTRYGRDTRLSVSTTSSRSSDRSRASVLSTSTSTSISSVSSQTQTFPIQERCLPPPPSSSTPQPPLAQITKQGSGSSSSSSSNSTSTKYYCTSCETTFARKYDWKRHEDEFHERYAKYPCPGCNRVFWGANTFNHHHRTAHSCTTCPHAEQVIQYTKRKRAWGCGVCAAFLPSKDRFFDHVAKHYEAGSTRDDWLHSKVIYGLLHQPNVHLAWKELVQSLYGAQSSMPNFSWNPETTGRTHGFCENASPGKLQDFLEFFSETSTDAGCLVQLAYDMADITPREQVHAPPPPPPPPSAAPPPTSYSHYHRISLPVSKLSTNAQRVSAATAAKRHRSAPQEAQKQQQRQQQRRQQQISVSSAVVIPTHFEPSPIFQGHAQGRSHGHRIDSGGDLMDMDTASPRCQIQPTIRYPETIVEEAPEPNYFGLDSTTATTGGSHSHLPPVILPQNMFEDWSSLTTTIVDEPFALPDVSWGDGVAYAHPRGGT